mmetsp:Transcript_45911/g.84206  ORF Transcript_45911/g.84206 Transcript_45911/m.84206 type:complete len:232 (+) Transcript_45911:468-1163(+)
MLDQNDPGPAGTWALLAPSSPVLLCPCLLQAMTASWKLAAASASSYVPSRRFPPHATPSALAADTCAASVAPQVTFRLLPARLVPAGAFAAGAMAGGFSSAKRFLNLMIWPGLMPMSCIWLSCISKTTSMQSKPCSRKSELYLSKPIPVRNASTSEASLDCWLMAACKFAAAWQTTPAPVCRGSSAEGFADNAVAKGLLEVTSACSSVVGVPPDGRLVGARFDSPPFDCKT